MSKTNAVIIKPRLPPPTSHALQPTLLKTLVGWQRGPAYRRLPLPWTDGATCRDVTDPRPILVGRGSFGALRPLQSIVLAWSRPLLSPESVFIRERHMIDRDSSTAPATIGRPRSKAVVRTDGNLHRVQHL